MLEYFNGTMMYLMLYGNKDLYRRYENRVMSVSVKDFHTYAAPINLDVKKVMRGVTTLE